MTNPALHTHSFRIEHGFASIINDPYLTEYEQQELTEKVSHVAEVDSNSLSSWNEELAFLTK